MKPAIVIALLLALALPVSAETKQEEAAVLAARPTSAQVTIPRLPRAPKLEEFLSMEPPADLAAVMLKIDDFRMREPKDGVPATNRSAVYLGYDDNNLYVVWTAFDSEPHKIRARMTRREKITDDDLVQVWLDTFQDRRRAYAFAVNPFGIQMDRLYTENQGFDVSFDTLWHSAGKITEKGYVVLMEIPFRSLRFSPSAEQKWGLVLNRLTPRLNESDYWPAVTTRINGILTQGATAGGLQSISPGRNIQLIPYGGFRSASAISTRNGPPTLVHERAKFDGGVDAKFVLKDSFVFDITVNPDFSQVESDEPQNTANQRFETFFPEKRPFFIENASYFQTPIDLYFTRRIADPQFGLRVTGKTGPYALGVLLIDDQAPGRRVADEDELRDSRAYFGVVRLNRDIFKNSSVGFIGATRQYEDSYNRVSGFDTVLRPTKNIAIEAQAVASATKLLDGTYMAGPAYQVWAQYENRKLTFNTMYSDNAKGFRTQTGFFRRPDYRRFSNFFAYNFRNEGELLTNNGPRIFQLQLWDHNGNSLESQIEANWEFIMKRQSWVGVFANAGNETLRPEDFSVLPVNTTFHTSRRGFFFGTSWIPQLTVNADFGMGTRMMYFPSAGHLPESAKTSFAAVNATVRPFLGLVVDNRYLFENYQSRTYEGSIFTSHIARSRWNYQFTRELSVRFIAQYSTILANQLNTSLEPTKAANFDFLVTYLVNPGTAVYVGYNSNLQNYDPEYRRLGSLQRRPDSFVNDGRVVFAKVSYLLRF